eukprot:6090355-Prorocentrum_lima.AAC.1
MKHHKHLTPQPQRRHAPAINDSKQRNPTKGAELTQTRHGKWDMAQHNSTTPKPCTADQAHHH